MQTRFFWLMPFLSFFFGYFVFSLFLQKRVVIAPCLIGCTVTEAIKIVGDNCLNLRFLKEKEDFDLPEGIVLSQIPQPHQKIRPNQHVFVTISKRPQQLCAPILIGRPECDMGIIGKQAGVTVKTCQVFSMYPKGTCVGQCPGPGRELIHKRLTAYVATGKNTLVIVPDFTGKALKDVEALLKQEGVSIETVAHKKARKTFDSEEKIVLDQKPMAGSIVDMSKPLFFQLQSN